MKNDRFCLECGITFAGRIDKKFCSDQCRSQFHNRRERDHPDNIRNVNSILRQNRKILFQALGSASRRELNLEFLSMRGFQFHFHTHSFQHPSGENYRGIYDLAWRNLNEKQIEVRLIQGFDSEK
ncbi:MAG: hypothetical protein K1X56_11005 [Flavobacteriales bacterium]|nr:hypothetical protein [Flavobacteriales bacterium]